MCTVSILLLAMGLLMNVAAIATQGDFRSPAMPALALAYPAPDSPAEFWTRTFRSTAWKEAPIGFVIYKETAEFVVICGDAGENSRDVRWREVESIPVCAMDFDYAPKRMEGDMRTPEGVYHINAFNTRSAYHLSLGINYPNAADRIRSRLAGVTGSLGGDIFIHGNCVTAGCIALTDPVIELVYYLAERAVNRGSIPVLIFPGRRAELYETLIREHADEPELRDFYRNLSEVHKAWQTTRRIPSETADEEGRYVVK